VGTNFYIRGHGHNDDPGTHIGKRSAAGLYCWDCKTTLKEGGIDKVHGDGGFHQECPKCGKSRENEELSDSAAGRELGFNKGKPQKKTGIKSCSSFSWAMTLESMKEKTIGIIPECPNCGQAYEDTNKVIEDEYGRVFTFAEFEEILLECPIELFDMLGVNFS